MENASETDVIHIIGKVHLAGIESVAATEIEPVVGELSGEEEAP